MLKGSTLPASRGRGPNEMGYWGQQRKAASQPTASSLPGWGEAEAMGVAQWDPIGCPWSCGE